MKRTTGLLFLPLLLLAASACQESPSQRKPVDFPWKDGTVIKCIEPPPDVMVKGIRLNADVTAEKIGTLLKGAGGAGFDIERIRQEVPADVSAFEVVEFRICVQYGNQVLSKEQYVLFTEQIIPTIKKNTPEKPGSDPTISRSPNIVGDRNVVIVNQRSELSGQESTDSEDRSLYFECDMKIIPKTIPDEGLNLLFFIPKSFVLASPGHPGPASSFYELMGPGREHGWSDPEQNGGAGYKCVVTNFGKNPVFEVIFTFALRFREVIPDSSNSKTYTVGEIKSAIAWPTKIRKLGANEKFSFFVINRSKLFLEVYTPKNVNLQNLIDTKTRKVRFRSPYEPGHFGFHLRPLKSPLSEAYGPVSGEIDPQWTTY